MYGSDVDGGALTTRPTSAPGGFSTAVEREVPGRLAQIFDSSPDDLEVRLANLPRYMRRSHVTRFAALYELLNDDERLEVCFDIISLCIQNISKAAQ